MLCAAAALSAALLFTPARAQTTSTPAANYQGDSTHSGFADVPGLTPPLKQKWSVNFGQAISYPVIAEGKVFVTVRNPSAYGTQLHALDAATGQPAWGPIPLGGTYYWSALCYEDGRLFAINGDGLLRAFHAASGDLVWSRQLPGQWSFTSPPTVRNGVVYTAGSGSGGTVYAVSATTGTVLWTAPVANGGNSSPAVTDDALYVSYSCPNVYKLNPVSGALIWRYSTGCSGGGGKTAVPYGGRLYVRDNDPDHIFDAQTGARLGSLPSQRTVPAFSDSMGFFMRGPKYFSGYGTLEARELAGHTVVWSFGGYGLKSAPLVVNEHVYVGSENGRLHALEAATGREVWSATAGSAFPAVDEQNSSQPLTGFAAAEGILVVPTTTTLVAYEHDPGPFITWGKPATTPNNFGWYNTPVELPFTAYAPSGEVTSDPVNPLRLDAEGTSVTGQVAVTNAAGDTRTFTSPAFKIDVTAPATASQVSGTSGSEGWYYNSASVNLTRTDNVSGIYTTNYRLNGGSTFAGTYISVWGDGVHQVSYWSSDFAGNVESPHSLTVKVDEFPPTTQAKVSPAPGANNWYKAPAEVTLTAADTASGVAATYYTINDGATQTYTAPWNVTRGMQVVKYWSVDVSGRVEQRRSLVVNVDDDTPATQFSAAGTLGSDGWYRGDVQVTLSASDAQSGVAATHYTLDGGAAQPYAGAFTVNGDGTHTVSYWSTDRAGNAGAAQSATVKIDANAPTTEATVSGTQGANGWYQNSARVTLTASDATSGVASINYAVDGGATQTYSAPFDVPAGSHMISYWSVDAAGGAEPQRTLSVNVDAGAPATQFSAAGTAGGGGWYRSNVQVTLSGADSHSGVATTYYSVDGGAAQTYAGAFAVSGNGRHQVAYWSVDHAGNAEAQRTSAVNIDLTAPDTVCYDFGALGGPGYYRSDVQIELTASDSLSGVASIHYRVGGGPAQTFAGAFMVTGDGTHLVEYWSVDAAGNVGIVNGLTIRIDSTAPVTQAAVAGPAGDNGWYRGLVMLTLSAADAFSGVGRSYYAVNGGSPQTYSGPFGVAADGAYTINYWSEDKAYNTEARRALVVRVDANAPAITASASPATRTKSKSNVSVTISGRVTDAASGVRPGSANFFVTDEYGVAQPSGPVVLQADGSYSFTLSLPATRNSRDADGHKYTITVRALDGAGNAGAASAVFTIL